MKSGQHLKLPKSELGQMEDDLRRQARMERLKIDIKVKDNGDNTVDICVDGVGRCCTSDFDGSGWRWRRRCNCRSPTHREQ